MLAACSHAAQPVPCAHTKLGNTSSVGFRSGVQPSRGGRGARGGARRARAGPVPAGLLRPLQLLVAAQLALAPRPDAHRDLPGTGGMWLVGTGIGVLSTLLGIGGGTLTVPLLVYCNVPIHQAVGTSAACGLPIALAGAIGFVVAGWGEAGLPAGSSGYLYWPAVRAVVAGSAFWPPSARASPMPCRSRPLAGCSRRWSRSSGSGCWCSGTRRGALASMLRAAHESIARICQRCDQRAPDLPPSRETLLHK